jgi:MazG family protein
LIVPRRRHSLDDLRAVMVRLRDPETGCPWDVKQNFGSIAPYTIEEAYEVADAIDKGDLEALQEELGDLLLQVVYHAQMASERGSFDLDDVVDTITAKMIRRHPHVFADTKLRKDFESSGLWNEIKRREKEQRGEAGSEAPSLLDGVPLALPALTRSVKLQARAGEVGFDWDDLDLVFGKVEEELGELKTAIAECATAPDGRERVQEEFGDLLAVMANVARHLKIDPEAALRGANAKFARRFGKIEEALRRQGRRPEDSNLEEMDALWNAAKQAERSERPD